MLKNKKVQSVLQLLLSLALLSWLIWRVGLDEVIGTLADINWSWYLPAFLLFVLNIIIRAYRWYLLLHALNDRPTFAHLAYLYFVGFFANNFIPSGFGGDVVKIVNLRQAYGRGAEALSSVVMERITGLMGSALIALAAVAWNGINHTTTLELPLPLWLSITIVSLAIPMGFALMRWADPLVFFEKRLPVIRRLPKYDKLQQLAETVRRYPLPILLQSLAISLPFTISLVFIQFSIARALSVELPLSVFFLFVPIIAIVNLLPFTFNGLGVREGAYQFLFVPIGVPSASAIAMSLAFYFLRFCAGLIGGLFYALRSVNHMLHSPHAENL